MIKKYISNLPKKIKDAIASFFAGGTIRQLKQDKKDLQLSCTSLRTDIRGLEARLKELQAAESLKVGDTFMVDADLTNGDTLEFTLIDGDVGEAEILK